MLRQLAEERLLDTSPEAVERLERAIAGACNALEIAAAKRLMGYRRRVARKILDSPECTAVLDKLESTIDFALTHLDALEGDRRAMAEKRGCRPVERSARHL